MPSQNASTCPTLYDYHVSAISDETYNYAKEIICSSTVHSQAEARSLGLNAGIPLMDAVLPVGLNLTGNEWSSYQSQVCKSNENLAWKDYQQYRYDRTISDNGLAAMQACQEPVRAFFVIPPSGTMFSFYASVQGADVLLSAEVKPHAAVTDCDPVNPFGMNKASVFTRGKWIPMDVSGKRISFSCTWNSRVPVAVDIAFKNQGSRSPQLDAVKDPPHLTWHASDQAGIEYHIDWSNVIPNCSGYDGKDATKRCVFVHTQQMFDGDNTAFDHWHLELDAPGPVYQVTCQYGDHELY